MVNALKIAAIWTFVFVAFGMATATVLTSYGSVGGLAQVEDTVFYAGADDKLDLDFTDSKNWTYTVDENSGTNSWSFAYNFDETTNWYGSDFDMYVEAKSERDDGFINATWKYDGNELCKKSKHLSNIDNTSYQEINYSPCTGFNSQDVDSFKYELNVDLETNDDNGEVRIRRYDKTRVEVIS